MNRPAETLKDAQGFNIDENGYRTGSQVNKNPYLKKHDELWNEGQRHNLVPDDRKNPSLPILVKPRAK